MEQFRTASPARQIALIAIALLILCLLLTAIYYAVLRTSYRSLFTGLRPADAAAIVAELDRTKVPYRIADQGSTILVPEEQVGVVRLGVANADLPIKGTVGFELFNESDMGLTEFAQKINYQRALQGELARTIMTLEAVETARVHIALGERTIFRDDRTPPKASVTVLARPGKRLTADTVRGIRRLVAAAVPELDLANVVVVDDAGRVLSPDDPEIWARASIDPELRGVERHYQSILRQAMESVYPRLSAVVRVVAQRLPVASRSSAPLGDTAIGEGAEADALPREAFRLFVDIALPAGEGRKLVDSVRRVAADAIGADHATGDLITVSLSPMTSITPEPATETPGALGRGDVASEGGAELVGSALWVLAPLVGIIALLLLLLRRKSADAPLTQEQRAAYTERLRSLLEERERDAARSL